MLLIPYKAAIANTDIDLERLNPNEYNPKEFEPNTDFIHDDSLLLQNKSELSKEQKLLTFIPEQYAPSQMIVDQLFTTEGKGRKTVNFASQELGLFSEQSKYSSFDSKEQRGNKETKQGGLKTVYIIFILVLLLVVFMLISQSVQGKQKVSAKDY